MTSTAAVGARWYAGEEGVVEVEVEEGAVGEVVDKEEEEEEEVVEEGDLVDEEVVVEGETVEGDVVEVVEGER